MIFHDDLWTNLHQTKTLAYCLEFGRIRIRVDSTWKASCLKKPATGQSYKNLRHQQKSDNFWVLWNLWGYNMMVIWCFLNSGYCISKSSDRSSDGCIIFQMNEETHISIFKATYTPHYQSELWVQSPAFSRFGLAQFSIMFSCERNLIHHRFLVQHIGIPLFRRQSYMIPIQHLLPMNC